MKTFEEKLEEYIKETFLDDKNGEWLDEAWKEQTIVAFDDGARWGYEELRKTADKLAKMLEAAIHPINYKDYSLYDYEQALKEYKGENARGAGC